MKKILNHMCKYIEQKTVVRGVVATPSCVDRHVCAKVRKIDYSRVTGMSLLEVTKFLKSELIFLCHFSSVMILKRKVNVTVHNYFPMSCEKHTHTHTHKINFKICRDDENLLGKTMI